MYPSSWTISENSSCWGSADVSSPTLGPFHTLTSDDIAIEVRPSIQVDYFSHNWKDEELWASWRYLAAWKHSYSNGLRLEYASWRTWAKTKYNLKTVPPEILDWSKDSDITWLYGPLNPCHRSKVASDVSDPFPYQSCREAPNSLLDRKSILKKKTESEVLCQYTLSRYNLLQHTSAIMMAQEAKGGKLWHSFPMSITDLRQLLVDMHEDTLTTESSFSADSLNEERHVHFKSEVMQCVAVEAKDGNNVDDCMPHLDKNDQVARSNNVKTIAHLPPTRLKYHIDLSELSETPVSQRFKSSSTLATTMSMDTTLPLHAPANFLLDNGYVVDDDDDDDDNDDADKDFATPSQLAHHSASHWPPLFTEGSDKPCRDAHFQGVSPAMFIVYDDNGSPSVTIKDLVFGRVDAARHVIRDSSWW